MGGGVDSHRTTDVRAVLEPVKAFAERTGVAVLAITHPPKAPQAKAIHAATGSGPFTAAARVALLATHDPDDEDRRLLLPVKTNVGPAADGVGYRIVTRPVSNEVIAPYVAWNGEPVTVTANEALRASHANAAPKLTEAERFLKDHLSG